MHAFRRRNFAQAAPSSNRDHQLVVRVVKQFLGYVGMEGAVSRTCFPVASVQMDVEPKGFQ